jgi:hypothetical protein
VPTLPAPTTASSPIDTPRQTMSPAARGLPAGAARTALRQLDGMAVDRQGAGARSPGCDQICDHDARAGTGTTGDR